MKNKIILFTCIILLIIGISWYKNMNEKIEPSYNAESLITVDLSNDKTIIHKNENKHHMPASLAKLYVIEYAMTLTKIDDVVSVDSSAISMIKPNSSIANIQAKEYILKDLYAAMLVPSGNDAAYALANYIGSIISPQSTKTEERIEIFIKSLNKYLITSGYKDTIIKDPSGYDETSYTTVLDLKKVSKKLLKNKWFRDLVSSPSYTTILNDGTTHTWKNTNEFLDINSYYYNEKVIGIKTGTMLNEYNLIVLYKKHNKEFLICSLSSQSNYSRYDDVNNIIKTLEKSSY